MALPANFLDELRARTPLPALIGRRVRLARSGRQWRGCCPFHGEKTPSFYVYDDHYHCFGCGAHGDAITFVMQNQGAEFRDAVAQLAAEAGLDVPAPTQEAAAAERRRLDLHGVLEAAQASFRRRLHAPEGAAGLAYLRNRGLSDTTIERFGLGWSGEGRGALAAELRGAGVEPPLLAEAGLMREAEEPGRFLDLFFSRVTFPIRDRRGRIISFGGRTLGDGQPKYVNGPETALFSKRRTLYAADLARDAVRREAKLVVVEGYMDVISLHEAGFAGAVAPLGTALTEEQLGELWRLSPLPLLCFDGDAAGRRALLRAAELALPAIEPDRSLGVVLLPDGQDPDTLVRREGAGPFGARLEHARPLADAIYELMAEGLTLAVPEQRAALQTRLETAAQSIRHKPMAAAYRRAFLDRFFARPTAPAGVRPSAGARNVGPQSRKPHQHAAPPRAPIDPAAVTAERMRMLTAIVLRHPSILAGVQHAYAELAVEGPLAALRDAVLAWAEALDVLDSVELMNHLTQVGMAAAAARALASDPFPLPACAQPESMPADAASGWWHFHGLLHERRLVEDIDAAGRELGSSMSNASQRRVIGFKSAHAVLFEQEDPGG